MRALLPLALPLLLAAQAAPETRQNQIVMPLYKRVLAFSMASDFVQQPLQRNETQVLFEFVPRGEDFNTWTRLVTVRALRGVGASALTTRDIATRLFNPTACGAAGRLGIGPEEPVVGTLRLTVVTISCGRSPGTAFPGDRAGGGEQDFIYLFRDEAHVYSLNYAVRGPGFDTPPIDPASAKAFLAAQFGTVLLCASADEPGCKAPVGFAQAHEKRP